MKTNVKWVGDKSFLGLSDSGHNVVFDGNGPDGGAPSPMEMVLMTVGACASIDVVMMLDKDGRKLASCEVEISGERVDTVPRVFKKIVLKFVVSGENISDDDAKFAVMASADKYCSVAMMLNGKVDLVFEHKLLK